MIQIIRFNKLQSKFKSIPWPVADFTDNRFAVPGDGFHKQFLTINQGKLAVHRANTLFTPIFPFVFKMIVIGFVQLAAFVFAAGL